MNLIEFQNSLVPGDILLHKKYNTFFIFINFKKHCEFKKACRIRKCRGKLELYNEKYNNNFCICGIFGLMDEKNLQFEKIEPFITEEEFSI